MPSTTGIHVPHFAIEVATWSRQREHRQLLALEQPRQEQRDLPTLPMNRPAMPAPSTAATEIDASTVLDRIERLPRKTPFRDPIRN
jgi:hypothetical protein